MRYYALATDYDGTLAKHGFVDSEIISSLERVRNSGRKLILVTGRELDELLSIFPQIEIFERVVAENGALLYCPNSKDTTLLTDPPDENFVSELKKRNVGRISIGRAIVAGWKPYEGEILKIIRDLGLELQVIFNKDAVMVLPTGVNKASGLKAALTELKLSAHNVVGIGDAENDHTFLSLCECSFAVDNALPALKEKADFVTKGDHGYGVIELIDKLIEDDLCDIEPKLRRHELFLGQKLDKTDFCIKPYNTNIMVAGTSGAGKSTIATSFLERLIEKNYQFCIIDPEGDYQDFEQAVMFGNTKQVPDIDEVIKLLENPSQNCSVNLLGISLENRPDFFNKLLPALLELRIRTGRPHWLIIDETHHLLPSNWDPATLSIPGEMRGVLFITVHPDHVAKTILSSVDILVTRGDSAIAAIESFAKSLNIGKPKLSDEKFSKENAYAWMRRKDSNVFIFNPNPPKMETRRHKLKYAEGDLGPDRSFYFTGPDGKLNLRVQNLMLFLQIAEGIDDETWLYHLSKGDYSDWFREKIKDEYLGEEAKKIEMNKKISPVESRQLIRKIIEERYTGAA